MVAKPHRCARIAMRATGVKPRRPINVGYVGVVVTEPQTTGAEPVIIAGGLTGSAAVRYGGTLITVRRSVRWRCARE